MIDDEPLSPRATSEGMRVPVASRCSKGAAGKSFPCKNGRKNG